MAKRKTANPKKVQTNQFRTLSLGFVPVLKKRKYKNVKKIKEYKNILPTEENKELFLCEYVIGSTNNTIDECEDQCSISFIKDTQSIVLSFESYNVIGVNCTDLTFVEDVISTKMFATKFCDSEGKLIMHIYAISLPFPKFYKTVALCIKKIFQDNFNTFDSNNLEVKEKCDSTDLKIIMDMLKEKRPKSISQVSLHHPQLIPTLRPYQEEAVRWMLNQETQVLSNEEILHPLFTEISLKSGIIIYFNKYSGYIEIEKPLIPKSNKGGILAEEMGLGKTVEVLTCILLNRPSGKYSSDGVPTCYKLRKRKKVRTEDDEEIPSKRECAVPTSSLKSSTKKSTNRLALEAMYNRLVLNVHKPEPKTEPKIQCICSKQSEKDLIACTKCSKQQHMYCMGYHNSYGPYICPQCWMSEPLFDVTATLIVTPSSLRTQWCNEIMKHIRGKFKVLIYDKSDCNGTIYPMKLKNYDVVITTYNVLQNELRLTENEQNMQFRRKRLYSPPGCPLARVNWWRLCLDEAQMVEGANSMVSVMTRKLSANFRWAVTGTPISKNISDIHGLIEYLLISPYNDVDTWSNILYKPMLKGDYNPISNFLSQIMWRTEKKDVLNQINIPKQTFKEYLLEFSAVEKFFYKKEYEMCRDTFFQISKKFNPEITLDGLDKSDLNKMMAPFLSIRQACTHPNTAKGKYLPSKKNITSLKDLLGALITKNSKESEEILRCNIASLNGLAGINIIYENYSSAINYYRNVLQLASQFETSDDRNLQVDTLQLIHTMYNLSEIIRISENVEPTLRDSTLKEDCVKLEQKYVQKFMNNSLTSHKDWQIVYEKVEELYNGFILKEGQWYSDAVNYFHIHGIYNELLDKCQTSCENVGISCDLKYSGGDVLYIISTWDELICELRANAIDAIQNIYEVVPDENEDGVMKVVIDKKLITEATNCHLRKPKKAKKVLCTLCKANLVFVKYEVKLFTVKERIQQVDLKTVEGAWIPSYEECIFKALLNLMKAKKIDKNLVDDATTYGELIQHLKEEFKEIRKLWTHLYQQVNAQDEVDICKIRMEVKQPDSESNIKQKKNNTLKSLQNTSEIEREAINLINLHELAQQEYVLLADEKTSSDQLQKNLGIKKYLETLRKQQYEGQTPDPCPICKNILENSWSILSCGHAYCLECLQLHIQQARFNIQCALCRNKQCISDISYISKSANTNEADDTIIKGNYSTKIEAVVKLLIRLQNEDTNVKVLIFSFWTDILKYVACALEQNEINHALITNTAKIETCIQKFKDESQKCTALLLPIKLGGKGLNLIEATHVIIVEPILNPADELQAIGRIHRIGQNKETFVHKFVLKNTIEDNIHQAISTNSKNWKKENVCLQQLIDLFSCGEMSEEIITDNNIESEVDKEIISEGEPTTQFCENLISLDDSRPSTSRDGIPPAEDQ